MREKLRERGRKMENYIMIDGKKVIMSEETAESMRKVYNKKVPWRAEEHTKYWYVRDAGQTTKGTELKFEGDNKLFDCGNYFETEAEAEIAAAKIRYLLRAVQYNKTHGTGSRPRWVLKLNEEGSISHHEVGSGFLDAVFETEEIAENFRDENEELCRRAMET